MVSRVFWIGVIQGICFNDVVKPGLEVHIEILDRQGRNCAHSLSQSYEAERY